VIDFIGGEYENRTRVHGFAIRPFYQIILGLYVSKHSLTNRELNGNVSNALNPVQVVWGVRS